MLMHVNLSEGFTRLHKQSPPSLRDAVRERGLMQNQGFLTHVRPWRKLKHGTHQTTPPKTQKKPVYAGFAWVAPD